MKLESFFPKTIYYINIINKRNMEWKENDEKSCFYSISENYDEDKRTYGYDLDCTLFSKGGIDPLYILSEGKLKGNVVIFTNQHGIEKGKTTHKEVRKRAKELLKYHDNITFFYSTKKDRFRKPHTGMYSLFVSKMDSEIHLDFYCGDAAGRKGDFASTDLFFAQNIGLDFKTENLKDFNKFKPNGMEKYIGDKNPNTFIDSWFKSFEEKYMVVLIGPPGAGKSTFTDFLVKQYGFVSLSNDSTKSGNIKRLFSKTKDDRIVIDNTNPKSENLETYFGREDYNDIVIYFDFKKEFSRHMCNMRVELGGKYIPPIATNIYYKNLREGNQDIKSKEGLKVVKITKTLAWSYKLPEEFYYNYNLKE
jgi:bifunctional polynucleotide phosphatase/kinase